MLPTEAKWDYIISSNQVVTLIQESFWSEVLRVTPDLRVHVSAVQVCDSLKESSKSNQLYYIKDIYHSNKITTEKKVKRGETTNYFIGSTSEVLKFILLRKKGKHYIYFGPIIRIIFEMVNR